MMSVGKTSGTSEDEYFHRKEQELIERLRRKSETEAHRQGMAEAVGLQNAQILDVLQEMGFDRNTVVLIFLVPLLEVAWSDGSVSDDEREGVLRAARAQGVGEGTAAHEKLMSWLATRPDPVLFQRALLVVRDILRFQTQANRGDTASRLVAACEAVAEASGGFLGLGKVSSEERGALRRIAAAIEQSHPETASAMIDRLEI